MLLKFVAMGLLLSCSCAEYDEEMHPNEEAADVLNQTFIAGNLSLGQTKIMEFNSPDYAHHQWNVESVPDLMRVTINTQGSFVPALQVTSEVVKTQSDSGRETVALNNVVNLKHVGNNEYVGDLLFDGSLSTAIQLLVSSDAVANSPQNEVAGGSYSIEVEESPAVKKAQPILAECWTCGPEDKTGRTTTVSFAEGLAPFVTRLHVESDNGRLASAVRIDANGEKTTLSPWDVVSSGPYSGYIWVGNEASSFELNLAALDILEGLTITPFVVVEDDIPVQELHRHLPN